MAHLESQFNANLSRAYISKTEPPSKDPTPKSGTFLEEKIKYFNKKPLKKVEQTISNVGKNTTILSV